MKKIEFKITRESGNQYSWINQNIEKTATGTVAEDGETCIVVFAENPDLNILDESMDFGSVFLSEVEVL